MRKNTPHPGGQTFAYACVFLAFVMETARALCTPGNGRQSLAVAGLSSSFFATPDYKLCAAEHDTGTAHIGISCAALLTRPSAKTGQYWRPHAPFALFFDKSFFEYFYERLKTLTYKSTPKEAI